MSARPTTLELALHYRVRALAALRLSGASMRVISERETLDAIRERRASIARYGDGELEIMIGGGIHFHPFPKFGLKSLIWERECQLTPNIFN